MIRNPMRIRNLEDYNIPCCIVDIWEKNNSPYLLQVQKKAVRYYGILDYDDGKMRLPHSCATRNDKKEALLEKGITNYNNELAWEERDLIET